MVRGVTLLDNGQPYLTHFKKHVECYRKYLCVTVDTNFVSD